MAASDHRSSKALARHAPLAFVAAVALGAAGPSLAQTRYELVRVDVDLPEGSQYQGTALGSDGHVVGTFVPPGEEFTFGFRWRDGEVVVLPTFPEGSDPSPGLVVVPQAVDGPGMVVGDLQSEGFPDSAFWYRAPTLVSGANGWAPMDLRKINGLSETGRVVGNRVSPEGMFGAVQAVAWTLPPTIDGAAQDIRPLGNRTPSNIADSDAIGVSPDGTYVVGQARVLGVGPVGARWFLGDNPATVLTFAPPGAVGTELVDVSNDGTAAGTVVLQTGSTTASRILVLGRTPADFFVFPGLGGSSAAAAAINEPGTVVGFATDAQEVSRAVMSENDVLVDLRTRLHHRWRNYTMSEAIDIKDRGEILVQACCGTSCGVAVLRPALPGNSFEDDTGCGD